MPNIEAEGNYEGTVISAADIDERMIFKCKVETEDGRHAYPSAFMLNKAGGENVEVVDFFVRVFGWQGDTLDNLKAYSVGKRVAFYVKRSADGKYLNAFFSMKERKEVPPEAKASAQSKWDSIRGASRLNKAAAQAQGGDLAFNADSIPF
jgi:hypothetical protein